MDNDLANKINDIKTAVEYESKFSKVVASPFI